jgi:hypothetical protein
MNDLIQKIVTFIKSNILISILIGLGVIILIFPRLIRKIFGSPVRRKRRSRVIPRSVGRRKYSTSGTKKRAWQIKGSLAARRHMAAIRRRKR